MKWRVFLLRVGFVLINGLCMACHTKIAVIHWNDMHGHPLPFDDHGVGGLPAIATMIKQVRSEYGKVLVLDAGDYNTGRPESDLFKAEPMIKGFNLMKVDGVVLGNHEFDNGLSVLEKQKTLADFPLLSANVLWASGKTIADAPFIIRDFGKIRVGVFGLTTCEAMKLCLPANIEAVRFRDEVETAKDMVAELRQKKGCHVVIALVHMGIYADNRSGSRLLASRVSGIDLVVDGHTHTALHAPHWEAGPDGKMVPIVSAHQWGLQVGKGVLTVAKSGVKAFEWQAITINDRKWVKPLNGKTTTEPVGPQFEQDREVQAALLPFREKVEGILGAGIGVRSTALWPSAMVRMRETELGDLVADAIKWVLREERPHFAICNGGGIRADLPAGELTGKHLYTVLPFDNSAVLCTLKGSELQKLFDFIATIPSGKGAFPQVSDGVSFILNQEKGCCENILVEGAPIDPQKEYRVATNSYMAGGGDGYTVFLGAAKKTDSGAFVRDGCIEYLKSLGGVITPMARQRFTVIPR